jgi:uncharacterized membrane protein
MSTLVVVGYKDMYKAEEVRLQLKKLQRDDLLDLEDAVVAVNNAKGKIKLHHSFSLTSAGAITGSFWGALVGALFLMPIAGMAVGASAGAASGALTDAGIDDKFIKEMGATRTPGSSALFVLLREATPNPGKVLEELKGTGGTILQTSLAHEDEARLQAALNA